MSSGGAAFLVLVLHHRVIESRRTKIPAGVS